MTKENNELEGISGWLILVAIGVVLSPFVLSFSYIPIYIPIFQDGTWEALTSIDSQAYHPWWGPLLIGEIAFNTAKVLASFYLIYLFFTKHYLFPKLYAAIILVTLVFIPLDAWAVTQILPEEPMFDPATTNEFVRTLVPALIWVPYMFISKRVKATFVNKLPNE